ncbi:hypothetical protein C8Q72DRAFT_856996 [Fomitopsis betulina]|nr:hypothetical protein C8Q72DRAFT_856996 [Fomitopsis betulina]
MAAMVQAYPQAHTQPNKGTLIPGQTITVNKYTVQVERYLSQGGFAHVYLVRTATPVLNTTHHVLKRIAVPNEGMLTEVKKEVDIMRILQGHPNIVYLIDAAWHRLPNGTFEVFILMEFCAGGGIIDMMNRRLRERLTEPEILTIFCDVCEGLAAMHALKPPLLHRDLKVENILQASAMLYKLCDFGSATSVQKVPSNVQEIRMLEADLNRHTTLQYRAPEMVDVYLRRPVDEKSDVWALGVLLYKLCYYTTPFEEHGPLAILNVQYKIPPYPVYSQQMNTLIASMLREHGTQRPTVFELLEHSRFTYNVPLKAMPSSPTRGSATPLQTLSPNVSALNDLPNAGIEARDKVLEAIAPMRRGRPTPLATPQPSSPKKERAFEMDMKGVRGHKSGLAAVHTPSNHSQRDAVDAWGEQSKDAHDFSAGFSKTFGDSFQPSRSPQPTPSPRPPAAKDAFDGLGFSAQPPPPTLGEARKSRTGLASMHMNQSNSPGAAMSSYLSTPGVQMSGFGTSFHPPSSHSPMPSPSPRPVLQPSTTPSVPSWRPSSSKGDALTAEERFPSLEELDCEFTPPSYGNAAERFALAHEPTQPPAMEKLATGSRPPSRGGYMTNSRSTATDTSTSAANGPAITGGRRNMYEGLGVRSQNATGNAMRAPSLSLRPPQAPAEPSRSRERERSRSPQKQRNADQEKPQDVTAVLRSRPSAARRRRTKTPSRNNTTNDALISPVQTSAPSLPPRPLPEPSPRAEPRDWLTGAEEDEASARESKPIMRESPSKRASFIERSPIQMVKALEAEEVLVSYEKPERAGDPQKYPPTARRPTAGVQPSWERREPERERERQQQREERQRSPVRPKSLTTRKASGIGANPSAPGSANTRVLQLPPVDTKNASRTGTSSSPNGLTENWSPVTLTAEPAPLTAKSSGSSSEGPEDLTGYGAASTEDRKKQARRKGRQSSVHDLVDLWGRGLGEKEKETAKQSSSTTTSRVADPAKRRSVIMPSPAARLPPLASKPSFRSESPQLIDTSVPSRASNMGPPPSPHKRQPSATPSGSRIQATPMAAAPSMPPPTSGRSRPQSMFIASPSKPGYLQQPIPSPSPAPSTANALAPRQIRARAPGGAPRSRTCKSAAGEGSLMSPAAAAARFPRLSPSSSPVISKASLAVPDDAGQGRAERDSGRRSPGAGLPNRISPVPRGGDANGLPGRRSPLQVARETPVREREQEVLSSPAPGLFPTRKPTLPPLQSTGSAGEREEREPVPSPSPERPYQGVSKLIDRWQKAVDSSDPGVRKPVAKKAGVAR